ncbi:hypothetical protein WOLCODRAFT_159387 [Wolfiporia cocos MD-104 SS10]|uniref:Uncharacterized protein n=1 Tax=Wolfiporia cocos (strain MD-104) TaxID=742152 RepID=A0A2H3JZN7_WOLCO|nr:hypothetical protein WOLCODRAFT_159387 [Wolfiporia cocos MD-104 SS10]
MRCEDADPMSQGPEESSGKKKWNSCLENNDGTPFSSARIGSVAKLCREVFRDLLARGLAPANWTRACKEGRDELRRRLEEEFPEIGLCEGHWKAETCAKGVYPPWKQKNMREDQPPAQSTTAAASKAGSDRASTSTPRSSNLGTEHERSEDTSATTTTSASSIPPVDAPRPASPRMPIPSSPSPRPPSELEYQDQPSSTIPDTTTDATVAQTSVSEAQHAAEPIRGEKRPLEPVHSVERTSKRRATLVIKSALSRPQRGVTTRSRMDAFTTANEDNAGSLVVAQTEPGDKDTIQESEATNNATSADMPVPSASDSSAAPTTVAATKASRGRRYGPRKAITAKNLYGKEWHSKNPEGTLEEFEEHFRTLSKEVLQQYKDMEKELKKKK